MNNYAKQLRNVNIFTEQETLMQNDIWKPKEIGMKPDTIHAKYRFNFSRIKPVWFKQAVKRFVRFQSATKSYSSCNSYIVGLTHFGDFLTEQLIDVTPEIIDRSIILRYIQYLAKRELSIVSRAIALIHLRTFHHIVVQEKWLPWSKEHLIYSSDLPKKREEMPRFIPEIIISQLQQHLHLLPIYMQNLITILLETGRRISEICTLPFNCLEQDEQEDYFLRVNENKLKKSYLIPISPKCLQVIKEQQELVKQNTQNRGYMFPTKRNVNTPHISARCVNYALNNFAIENNIRDTNGEIWHFHTHQFRHTVGTRMINTGVPQAIVQRYLGHESPEMTARYAYIHNETLKAEFNKYQGKLIDIHGKIQQLSNKHKDAHWLQHNIMAQALPNGICTLPLPQQRCPHANACLTCVHFRTNKKFLPQHLVQLETTNKIIETATENGWQRQLEMNLAVKQNLEAVIAKLQQGDTNAN